MLQIDSTTITDYLLGKLPDARRDLLEQECFTNKAKYDELCEAENTLIDDYVRGYLSASDQALFEQKFLTLPQRKARVQAAQVLLAEIDAPQHRKTWPAPAPDDGWFSKLFAWFTAPRLITAVACLVVLLAGAVNWRMWQQNKKLREAIAVAEVQQKHPVQDQPEIVPGSGAKIPATATSPAPTKSPQTKAAAESQRNISLLLTAAVLPRSEDGKLPQLKLTSNIQQVNLQCNLPDNEFEKFAVTLLTAAGAKVAGWHHVPLQKKGSARQLGVQIAAQKLQTGDYVLVVNGAKANAPLEEFTRLPFRVERKN